MILMASNKELIVDEWDPYREIIWNQYVTGNLTLQKLIEHMDKQYGRKASKSQVELLLKKWNFRKNMSTKDWEYLNHQMSRKRKGRPSTVEFNGCIVPEKRLKKGMSRVFVPTAQRYAQDPRSPQTPETPPGLLVYTPQPTSDFMLISRVRTTNLPWADFCSKVDANDFFLFGRRNRLDLSTDQVTDQFSELLEVMLPDARQYGSLFLDSITGSGEAGTSLQTLLEPGDENAKAVLRRAQQSKLIKVLLQHTIYLATNNLLELEASNTFFTFLTEKYSLRALEHSSICNLTTYQALAPRMLIWAATKGNLEVARTAIAAGANAAARQSFSGLTCTPLEIACKEGHAEVVEFLLSHGADVNEPMTGTRESLLYDAIFREDFQIARLLLRHGASVSYRPWDGAQLPIHAVAARGDVALMEDLLKADSTVINDVDQVGDSAMSIAGGYKRQEIVEVLLRFGASKQGSSRLLLQCETVEDFQEWIDMGGDVNQLHRYATYDEWEETDDRGEGRSGKGMISPLQCAARTCDLGSVQLLLDEGAELDDPSPLTALIASYHSEQDIIDLFNYFLDNEADINAQNPPSNHFAGSALYTAMQRGSRELFDFLLSAGAEFQVTDRYLLDGFMSLTRYWSRDNEFDGRDWIQDLLRRGMNINSHLDGETALFRAIKHRNLEMTAFLLESGAEVNFYYLDYPWCAALYLAIKSFDDYNDDYYDDYRYIVKLLVKHGAAMNELDQTSQGLQLDEYNYFEPLCPFSMAAKYHGWIDNFIEQGANVNTPAIEFNQYTPLQSASQSGHVFTVELLLEAGARVNQDAFDGERGRTALQAACSSGKMAIVKLLVDAGAEINAPAVPRKGITALQGASIAGNIEMVMYLLDRDADVNAPAAEFRGRTALEGAAEHGRLDIVQLLINAGAEYGVSPELRFASAIKFAESEGYFAVANLLKSQREENVGGTPRLEGETPGGEEEAQMTEIFDRDVLAQYNIT